MNYEITELKEENEQEYRNFILKHNSLIEFEPEWRKIVESNFGFKAIYLIAKKKDNESNGGGIAAVLPLFEANSFLFGKRLISTPFAVHTGILSDEKEEGAVTALTKFAKDLAKLNGYKFLEIRKKEKDSSPDNEFTVKEDVYDFSLKINRPLENIWKFLPKNSVRWGIKKAKKSNLTIRSGNSRKELNDFYNLFLTTRKYRGVPAYPKPFFIDILDTFKEKIKIYVCEFNNEPVAAVMMLFHNKRIRYFHAGTKPQTKILRMQPYHLLFWTVITEGHNLGYETFDLGGSTKLANNGGLYSFKEKWADSIKPIPSYYYSASGKIPLSSTSGIKLAGMIWKKLPLKIVDKISPFVIKQFV